MVETMTADEYRQHLVDTGQVAPPIPQSGTGKQAKEKLALTAWLHATYPGIVSEHRFHPTRRWRFDWALPDLMVAIEFDGVVSKMAHATVTSVLNDSAKMNEAALLGWTVIRTNSPNLRDGSGYKAIERAVEAARKADGDDSETIPGSMDTANDVFDGSPQDGHG